MNTKNKSSFVLTRLSVICLLALTTLTFQGCGKKGGDPAPTEIEKATKQLNSGTWKVQSVKIDDVDHTVLFTGFTLQFTPTTFTTTNGGEVWPASGNWTFTDASAKKITRSDDVEVTLDAISESQLVLSLKWESTSFGSGRSTSLSGVHKFTFTK
jgi:hypothetical protein